MNIKYQFALPVTPDKAWDVLKDIPSVAPCMPGASLEASEGDEHTGRIKVKLGPIDMTFRGTIKFKERDEEQRRAVLEASASEMKGGGSAKATVLFFVTPAENGSVIAVESDFTVSGKAAQFGGGVIDSVGKKLIDQFATRLAAKIEATQGGDSPSDGPVAATSVTPPQAQKGKSAAVAQEDEVLDLLSAAWKPVAIRVALSLSVIGLVGFGLYHVFV